MNKIEEKWTKLIESQSQGNLQEEIRKKLLENLQTFKTDSQQLNPNIRVQHEFNSMGTKLKGVIEMGGATAHTSKEYAFGIQPRVMRR